MVSLISGIVAFLGDQLVKCRVENGEIEDGRKILHDHITIRKSHNGGFVMNKCDKSPKLVLAICSGVFGMALFTYLKTIGKKHRGIERFGLGLVLGGAASNLTDRIRKDEVTDYAFITGHDKVIFNIGDIAVCIGSFIAALGEILSDED